MAQFLEPLLWPAYNIAKAFQLKEKHEDENRGSSHEVLPYLDFSGHMMVVSGSIRAFLIAFAVVYYITPDQYPALGSAGATLEYHWIINIFVRNILGTWLICGFWDGVLLSKHSPLQKRLQPYKMNPKYPPTSQLLHDAIFTTMASCIASAIEVWYCHNVATGALSASTDLCTWDSLLWIAFNTHFRLPHFYATHRMMHPWRKSKNTWMGRYAPDIGQFLYKHVHSVHHKSHNPTAFSGTSMHPVEAATYYSACLLPILCKRHPTIVLACIFDCAIGAWTGHDGFQLPYGMGDDFHQLHHEHSDCNYGTSIDSLDWLMGTSIGKRGDLKDIQKE